MGRKSLRVNVSKTKSMQLLLDKKSSVSKWILVVSAAKRLVVILVSV